MEQKKQTHHKLYVGICLAIAAILLAADQIFKYFVLRDLKPIGSVTVIDGLLELTYIENTGAAFGLFKNMMWLLILITLVAFVVITVLLFRYQSHTFFSYTSSALLIAGGIGNLLDRVFYGFVVDYIHVMFFDYIFNFADCAVTVGTVLFVIHVVLISMREKLAEKDTTEVSERPE